MYHVSTQGVDERMINLLLLLIMRHTKKMQKPKKVSSPRVSLWYTVVKKQAGQDGLDMTD